MAIDRAAVGSKAVFLADQRPVAVGDSKTGKDGGRLLSTVEIEPAMWLIWSALTVDNAVIRAVLTAYGDGAASKIDISIFRSGVRPIGQNYGIAVPGHVDCLLNSWKVIGYTDYYRRNGGKRIATAAIVVDFVVARRIGGVYYEVVGRFTEQVGNFNGVGLGRHQVISYGRVWPATRQTASNPSRSRLVGVEGYPRRHSPYPFNPHIKNRGLPAIDCCIVLDGCRITRAVIGVIICGGDDFSVCCL